MTANTDWRVNGATRDGVDLSRPALIFLRSDRESLTSFWMGLACIASSILGELSAAGFSLLWQDIQKRSSVA